MSNYWGFYVFYTLGNGLNTGIAYLVTTHHTWLWFPSRPGLASGICFAGYGLGSLVFGLIETAIINPEGVGRSSPCHPGDDYACYPESVNSKFKE